jgi:hypothetical protein
MPFIVLFLLESEPCSVCEHRVILTPDPFVSTDATQMQQRKGRVLEVFEAHPDDPVSINPNKYVRV